MIKTQQYSKQQRNLKQSDHFTSSVVHENNWKEYKTFDPLRHQSFFKTNAGLQRLLNTTRKNGTTVVST